MKRWEALERNRPALEAIVESVDRARGLVVVGSGLALAYEVPGRPISWKRTDGTHRRHTPPEMREAKISHHDHALAARGSWQRREHRLWPLTREYALTIVAYLRDRRGLPDVDNLAKLVADALQGAAYDDDRRVAKLVVERRFDPERPRTEVLVQTWEARS